jgi:hypothetical protein
MQLPKRRRRTRRSRLPQARGGFAGRISSHVHDFGQRSREGLSQRQDFLRPRAGLALRLLCGVQNGHHAFSHSWRGAPAE